MNETNSFKTVHHGPVGARSLASGPVGAPIPRSFCAEPEPDSFKVMWRAPDAYATQGRRALARLVAKLLDRLAELEHWPAGGARRQATAAGNRR